MRCNGSSRYSKRLLIPTSRLKLPIHRDKIFETIQ